MTMVCPVPVQLLEELQDYFSRGGIQAGGRLISKQYLGLVNQRARNGRPLLLSPETRSDNGSVFLQPHRFQNFPGPLPVMVLFAQSYRRM